MEPRSTSDLHSDYTKMVAETEMPKTPAIEDLPMPDCNGTNHNSDPDNSYVFVSGFIDDPAGNKDAVTEVLRVLPESNAQLGSDLGAAQNAKLDVVGENDGERVQVPNADSLDEHNGKAERSDIKQIDQESSVKIEFPVRDQAGKTESPEEAGIKDPNAKFEIIEEAAVELVRDQNGKAESRVETEVKQVEDPNGKLDTTAQAAIKLGGDQRDKTESLAEAAIKQVEDTTAIDMVGDKNGKTESVGEAEIEQVEDPNKKIEISVENEVSLIGDQYKKDEAVARAQQEKVEDLPKPEPYPGPVENQESQVEALELISESRDDEEKYKMSSHNNKSSNSNDECEGHISTSAIESIAVNVIECGSLNMNMEGGDEVKLVGEVVEKVGVEVPFTTPLESALESHPTNNKDETLEEEANKSYYLDVNENRNRDTAVEDNVQYELKETETKVVLNSTDLEDKNVEDLSVSHIQILPASSARETRTIIEISNAENIEEVSSSPVGSPNVQIIQNGLTGLVSCTANETSLGSETMLNTVVSTEKEPTFKSGESHAETEEVSTGKVEVVNSLPADFDVKLEPESDVHNSSIISSGETASDVTVVCTIEVLDSSDVNNQGETKDVENLGDQNEPIFQSEVSNGETGVAKSPPATCDVKLKPETDVHYSSVIRSGETVSDVTVVCTTEVLDRCDANNEGETEDGKNVVDQKEPTSQTAGSSGEAIVAKSPPATSDVKLEPEAYGLNSLAISSGETTSDVTVVHRTDVLDSFDVNNEGETKDVENSGGQKEPTFQSEISIGKAEVAKSPTTNSDVKFEPEADVNNVSAISSDTTSDVTVICTTEVLSSVAAKNEGQTKDVEDTGDQLDCAAGSSSESSFLLEKEESGKSHSNGISVIDKEEETGVKTTTKPFNFLIRVPRFDDESLREQIKFAKLHVDEKTKLRDAIQGQIQEIRANSQIHGVDYEYAKDQGRNTRKLVRSKRMEIDSLQSVINKAKNALSIEDIDRQIYNMEHMIQHETLPLKEEKQLIREIKQLKQLREQLSSNMGSQDEIKQALEQREEVEERLKILKKELHVLKTSVLKAEAAAVQAEKKYDDENKNIKDLQAQFRAANDVRQEAYAKWQNLRKELSTKNTHFFRYKDDSAVAGNYAFGRNTEALYCLCTNHVENFMELWNTSEEFRKDYVKFNARSTVRRLGTLDGRSLGPDENPPILPSYFDERANRMVSKPATANSVSQIPIPEQKQERTVMNVMSDDKLMKKVTEHKNQKVTNKGPAKIVQANGLDIMSLREVDEEVHKEPKMSKEELELIKRAEEKRKEEADAKLKEEHRLEGLAKAKEARERKKRQAEKLQLRVELKTQKEAELKEKEREKRLRKKERKKGGATDVNDTNNNGETAPSSESSTSEIITKDVEVKETTSAAITKKAQKPWLFTKQSKNKSIPPPLRNRNKKKWQQWMWVGFTCIVIFALFWLGNIGVFGNMNLRRRSPIQ